MADILTRLAIANLAAAAAVLLVLALRAPARRAFGARIAYGLWLAPVLAAAATFLPARLPTPAATLAQVQAETPFNAIGGVIQVGGPRQALFDLTPWLLGAWALGAAIALGVLIWNQRRFVAEARLGGVGPAVVGVIAPRILKPHDFAQRFTPDEQRLVLEHEQVHITRQDSRINGALVLIQCLNWFNPLLHLGARFLRIDQELACDEQVLSRFPSARTLYAAALLKAQLANRPLPLGCYWPAGTEHPLFERIAMIKRDEFSRARRLAGAAALGLLCAAAGLAAWAAQPPQDLDVKIDTLLPPLEQTYDVLPPPGSVSLTNSGGRLASFPTRNPAAVAAAIRAGDIGAVMRAGGTAADAAGALRTGCAGGQRTEQCDIIAGIGPGTEFFVRGDAGELLLAGISPQDQARGISGTVWHDPAIQSFNPPGVQREIERGGPDQDIALLVGGFSTDSSGGGFVVVGGSPIGGPTRAYDFGGAPMRSPGASGFVTVDASETVQQDTVSRIGGPTPAPGADGISSGYQVIQRSQ